MSHDDDTYSRRTFLKKTGAAGVAVVGGTLWATSPAAARARRGRPETPLRHVVISCQENRSFDHYFGYAPQVQAAGYGPPRGYLAARRNGRSARPVRAHGAHEPDPPHWWQAVHEQVARRQDGRLLQDVAGVSRRRQRRDRLLHRERELPFYYSLFRDSGLCANYFCSVLGPTWPNRFYLMSGTSGGITTNGQWGYGIFDSSGGRSSSTCSTSRK